MSAGSTSIIIISNYTRTYYYNIVLHKTPIYPDLHSIIRRLLLHPAQTHNDISMCIVNRIYRRGKPQKKKTCSQKKPGIVINELENLIFKYYLFYRNHTDIVHNYLSVI